MKIKNQVRELYTRRASLYERVFVDFLGWSKQLEGFFQKSDYLCANYKILDAGCGTGIATRVLHQLASKNGFDGVTFHAFDLTQNMLKIFQRWIAKAGADHIELQQADVLEIHTLPTHWKHYDLIISSTMLEYLPRRKVEQALTNLRQLLKDGGTLLAFITRRTFITQWLAEKWWKTNTYDVDGVRKLFHEAGFHQINFKDFSPRWSNYILVVDATK